MAKGKNCGEKNPAYKHGHSTRNNTSNEYWIWSAMIQRCTNKNNKGYHNYGGRGIKVCDEWLNSFEQFISDMGLRPSRKHSIERVNNNKGYNPENCIWATKDIQQRNRRIRKDEIVFNGETATQASLRLSKNTYRRLVQKRIKELGWDIEKAFTTPKRNY